MAKFKVFDENGKKINTIVADVAFMQENFPGRFSEEQDLEPAGEQKKTVGEKLDEILALLETINSKTTP